MSLKKRVFTKDLDQLLIDRFIQTNNNGSNDAERLMERLDKTVIQREKLPVQNVGNCNESEDSQPYKDFQECGNKILNSIEVDKEPQRRIEGLRILLGK